MIRAALFFLLLALAFACVEPSDDGSYDPNMGRIRFRITEGHRTSDSVRDPEIGLTLETETIYGCFNFGIVHEVQHNGNAITVKLQSIFKPEICLTAIGPAQGYSPLNLPPGAYRLRFLSGTAADEYDLRITDSTIILAGTDTTFAVPNERLAWRYPRSSFAFICGSMTTNTWVCSDFLDSLARSGRFSEIVVPSTGWYPYPRSSGGYWSNPPSRVFRYATEADFDTAGAMLQRYVLSRTKDEQGVGLQLVNWRNRQFLSWMMVNS